MKASIILVGVAAAALAACGGIGGGSTAAKSSPSPAGAIANNVVGQVTKVAGGKVTVNGRGGDATVSYDGTTQVLQSGSGTLTDAVAGSCVLATGMKDASGVVTAMSFQVQLNMNGVCNTLAGGARPGASPRPGASARPNGSPFPDRSPGAGGPGGGAGVPANLTVVRGKVSAVNGTTVTVQQETGGPVMVTVPSSATITRLVTSSTARLAVGECVTATGTQSSGSLKARNILISAPGPNGCTGGGAFGGGFGGGGRRPGASPSGRSA